MQISVRSILALTVLALLCQLSANPLLSFLSVSVLAVGYQLIWRRSESPILMFVFGYQWLQASTKVFHADVLGVDVDELSSFGGDVSHAILLSLVGLFLLAVGMRLALGPARQKTASLLGLDVTARTPLYWFKLYVVAFGVATMAQSAARVAPGLSQPLLALASMKWAFYWVFAFATFSRPDASRILWVIVFVVELALGFGSYFSDFRAILLFSLLALIPAGLKLTAPRVLGLIAVGALTLAMGVIWTAIKPEYRKLLSDGQRAQVVTVSYVDSIKYLFDLTLALDGPALASAATAFANRVSYVDTFARTIDHVPAIVPHEDGAIWADAILRPFQPRLLFPEKSIIDDSQRTIEFTGLRVATSEEGASISIGYMGEAYIDFGPYLMFAPILLLGWVYGRYYRWLSGYRGTGGVLGVALATAVLYPASQFETSITKLVGGLVISMFLSWVLARWVIPHFYGNRRQPASKPS